MIIKIKSGLQTKNQLGLSQSDLDNMVQDPDRYYLRYKGHDAYSLDRRGSLIEIKGVPMKIHKDYAAIVQPNPELHKYGIVSFNPILTGECTPVFHIKAHQAASIELDWLYEIRMFS